MPVVAETVRLLNVKLARENKVLTKVGDGKYRLLHTSTGRAEILSAHNVELMMKYHTKTP